MSYIFWQFWPYHTKNLLVIWCSFVRFSTFLAPLHLEYWFFFSLDFSTCLALLHQTCWVFTGFSSSDAYTGFFLFWCKTSHMRTQTYHHGASRICNNLQICWPKTILVCKAIFYTLKNKYAIIYLCKAIFYIFGNYSPKTKVYVCNRFGRNGRKGSKVIESWLQTLLLVTFDPFFESL